MNEASEHQANAEQIAYWNGRGGAHWTRRQEINDAILVSISNAVLERAAVVAGERIIDAGCGCGDTSIALAARAGPAGHVLGVDVSVPMLARARKRAAVAHAQSRPPVHAPLDFVCADAAVHPFEANVDLLFSRFGVMFFDDPVRAFANMKPALRPGGRLVFVCWRAPALNPWLLMSFQAVRGMLPPQPETKPDAPGPFAFARQERIRHILADAGFESIALEPADFSLDLANGLGLDAAVETAMEMGPTGRALDGQPGDVMTAVAVKLRETFAPYQSGPTVKLGAAVWIVTARA